jgi:hypothetical protein
MELKRMENRIPKPEELTDAEAEAFIRYLGLNFKKKKSLLEAFLETQIGKDLLQKWTLSRRKSSGQVTSEITFHRAPYGHALAHASKGNERTLCGIHINSTWACLDEESFHHNRPCKECEQRLKFILRKGRQKTL